MEFGGIAGEDNAVGSLWVKGRKERKRAADLAVGMV
jgi:hypothetical protein